MRDKDRPRDDTLRESYQPRMRAGGLGPAHNRQAPRREDWPSARPGTPSGSAFPVCLLSSSNPAAWPGREREVIRGQGKILVMDDDVEVRKVAGRMLGIVGFEVELARDGAEAVAKYRSAREVGRGFDAVVMDLTVPEGMGAIEAIEKIRELDPRARAILSSGYSSAPAMFNYREHGFLAVIRKPYRLKELCGVLNLVLKEPKE